MWCLLNDQSDPIIKAKDQINSAHRECNLNLPETAIVFFMSKGVEYLCENYEAKKYPELFPRFLNRCPIWEIEDDKICFLDGGRSAPQACDTVETLAALGVKNLIAVGMCGAFDPRVEAGQIIAPNLAFVEEGTSLHYYQSIECSTPDGKLLDIAASQLQVSTYPIVSTDAVYRQTFEKERLWREKGAVGVDMEMSVVFSVSRYLGLKAVGLLMISDIHPLNPGDPKWEWQMTKEMRHELAEKGMSVAQHMRIEQ